MDVSDVQLSYSVCTTVSIRVRFAREFGMLLLPPHTYRPDGHAYVYLADVLNIRAIGACRAVERSPPHGPVVIVVEIIVAYQWFCSFVTQLQRIVAAVLGQVIWVSRPCSYTCVVPLFWNISSTAYPSFQFSNQQAFIKRSILRRNVVNGRYHPHRIWSRNISS